MRELGVQAANDTYDSAARTSIGTELVQLRTEIDRIANATNFNGQNLLTDSSMLVRGVQFGIVTQRRSHSNPFETDLSEQAPADEFYSEERPTPPEGTEVADLGDWDEHPTSSGSNVAGRGPAGGASTDEDTAMLPAVDLDRGLAGDASLAEPRLATHEIEPISPDPPDAAAFPSDGSRGALLNVNDAASTGQLDALTPEEIAAFGAPEDHLPERDEPTDIHDAIPSVDEPTAVNTVVDAVLAADDLAPLDPEDGAEPPPDVEQADPGGHSEQPVVLEPSATSTDEPPPNATAEFSLDDIAAQAHPDAWQDDTPRSLTGPDEPQAVEPEAAEIEAVEPEAVEPDEAEAEAAGPAKPKRRSRFGGRRDQRRPIADDDQSSEDDRPFEDELPAADAHQQTDDEPVFISPEDSLFVGSEQPDENDQTEQPVVLEPSATSTDEAPPNATAEFSLDDIAAQAQPDAWEDDTPRSLTGPDEPQAVEPETIEPETASPAKPKRRARFGRQEQRRAALDDDQPSEDDRPFEDELPAADAHQQTDDEPVFISPEDSLFVGSDQPDENDQTEQPSVLEPSATSTDEAPPNAPATGDDDTQHSQAAPDEPQAVKPEATEPAVVTRAAPERRGLFGRRRDRGRTAAQDAGATAQEPPVVGAEPDVRVDDEPVFISPGDALFAESEQPDQLFDSSGDEDGRRPRRKITLPPDTPPPGSWVEPTSTQPFAEQTDPEESPTGPPETNDDLFGEKTSVERILEEDVFSTVDPLPTEAPETLDRVSYEEAVVGPEEPSGQDSTLFAEDRLADADWDQLDRPQPDGDPEPPTQATDQINADEPDADANTVDLALFTDHFPSLATDHSAPTSAPDPADSLDDWLRVPPADPPAVGAPENPSLFEADDAANPDTAWAAPQPSLTAESEFFSLEPMLDGLPEPDESALPPVALDVPQITPDRRVAPESAEPLVQAGTGSVDFVDLAEMPEEPGRLIEEGFAFLGAGGEVAIPRVTTGTSVGGWPQRSGPPSDIFSELANLDDSVISDPFDDLNDAGFEDDRAGKRVEGHDWWDYDDATQRNDDRGGFRAAANATEAVDLSGTEQMQMQASDLAAPPTSTKPSDLDSLDGPDSDAYEAALYAFFDAPGQKDNAGDEPGGTDTIDPEYDDGPRSRRERSTKRKRSNARRSKDSEVRARMG